jgi:simple sugar transport system permease protein
MKVDKIILRTIFISAGIAGLAGIIQASGVNKTLAVTLANGTGFTAIIIAWLSNLNAFITLIVSVLFSAMVQGGSYIQMVYNIPAAAASVLQGTILFFVLGSQFFITYKIKRN